MLRRPVAQITATIIASGRSDQVSCTEQRCWRAGLITRRSRRAYGRAGTFDLCAQHPYMFTPAPENRVGDLKLFELITMLRLSRYATAKSAVVYGLQGGRVSASACSAGPPWGDGGPTPPRRLAPSGSAIAKSEASVVPSGGSCTNSPGWPSAHSRCSSSRRAQCPHRPTPSRKAAHRESSASESSSARILVTDSWSFGRSRVTVFHTTSRSISK